MQQWKEYAQADVAPPASAYNVSGAIMNDAKVLIQVLDTYPIGGLIFALIVVAIVFIKNRPKD